VGFGVKIDSKRERNVSENCIKGASRCMLLNKQYLVDEIKDN